MLLTARDAVNRQIINDGVSFMTYAKTGLWLLVQEVSAAWMAAVKPTGTCSRRLLEQATIVLAL
jgi:hypothetical protein